MAEAPHGAADRVVYLLKLIAGGPSRFTLGELVDRADMPASSVHRLLKVLFDAGLVERGSGQSYRPGRELHRMASQLLAKFDLTRSARPFLEQLVADWQETAVLGVYSPTLRKALIADVVTTPHPLRFALEKGGEIALPWGSLGRAILAHLSSGEIETIMRETKTGPLSGRPRSTKREMEDELQTIRSAGHARYYDPRYDVSGIASPIFGAEGQILGCIGVTMPSRRFLLHAEQDVAASVRDYARQLSELAAISHS